MPAESTTHIPGGGRTAKQPGDGGSGETLVDKPVGEGRVPDWVESSAGDVVVVETFPVGSVGKTPSKSPREVDHPAR
jgi:hypothetical protein